MAASGWLAESQSVQNRLHMPRVAVMLMSGLEDAPRLGRHEFDHLPANVGVVRRWVEPICRVA